MNGKITYRAVSKTALTDEVQVEIGKLTEKTFGTDKVPPELSAAYTVYQVKEGNWAIMLIVTPEDGNSEVFLNDYARAMFKKLNFDAGDKGKTVWEA